MRDLQRKKRIPLKRKVSQYGLPSDLQMTRSGNLGSGVEGNGSGADLKQKGNMNLHSITVTSPLLAKEKLTTV